MRSLLLISICLLVLFVTPSLEAKTVAGQGKEPLRTWWGEIETGFIHDSNIFQTDSNPEADLIQESLLSLSDQEDSIKWSGLAIYDHYRKNSELSYAYFEVGAERPFGQRDYGSLFFNLSPSAPLDKQDTNTSPFALGSYGFTASFDRETDIFGNVGITLSFTQLDYDAPFDPKDTRILAFSPSLFYKINASWALFTTYRYESGVASAGTLPGGFHDDISYEAQIISLKIIHEISKKTRVSFRYRIRAKRFTTDSTDLLHVGRRDKNHSLYGALRYRIMKPLFLLSRIEHLWKNSTDSFLKFRENRLTVSVVYQF